MPLEEQYYPWLLFAPAKSPEWKNLVKRLYKEGQHELLDSARKLRPKEFKMVINDLIERAKAEMTPEEREAWERNEAEADQVWQELAEKLPPKIRLSGISPEQIADALSPEQLEALQKLLAQRKTNKKEE